MGRAGVTTRPDTQSLLDWALYYASKGIPVFPLARRRKYPAIPERIGGEGYKDATTDPEQIKEWWKQYPNANIGAATGHLFDVIDVDEGEVGRETVRKYEADLSKFVVVVKTMKGGYHLYCKPSTVKLSNKAKPKGLPGLDARTMGGYVVMPPSYAVDKGKEGPYSWREGCELNGQTLPDFPSWAVPFFKADAEHKRDNINLVSVFHGGLDDGKKHDQLRDAIFKMRKQGFDIEITRTIIESCIRRIPAAQLGESVEKEVTKWLKRIDSTWLKHEPNPEPVRPEPPEIDFRQTELGTSERFAHAYQDQIKYLPERDEWLVCDQDVWHPQPGGDAPAMVKAYELARLMGDEYQAQGDACIEAANVAEPERRVILAKQAEALHKKAANMERADTITKIIKLAKPLPGINAHLTGLDCDPWLLGTLDGVVDLRTLEVLADGKQRMVTRCIPHKWTPDETSDLFQETLATIMGYNADLIKLMRVWFGYLMVGHADEQRFMVWYGPRARNGKTTIWNVIHHVLGDHYAGPLDQRLIIQSRNPAPFALANVEGKRAVFASEPPRNARLDTEFLKRFSGREVLTAERKGVQGYDFRPVGKLMLACNELPSTQFDNALLNRMIAVPFDQSFYNEGESEWRKGDLPRDDNLENALKLDTPGIIGFLAQCCLEYQREGLIKPIDSHRLAADFEAENDLVGQWIGERIEFGDYPALRVSELYANFRQYCEVIGVHSPGGINPFSKRLDSEPGLERVKPSNVPHFKGVRIREVERARQYWQDKD